MKLSDAVISSSNASTQTYYVNGYEDWLYAQLIKVFLQDFYIEDIRDHGKEIMEQFIYELSINNINWIVEGR